MADISCTKPQFEQSDNGAILWRNFLDSIEPGNGAVSPAKH
jgi:hypothetical protein